MFKDLHALAQSATLLIVVTAEGDALRVSVTPTLPGDKPKAHALRPMTLLGSPEEMDADFGAALIAWQAPRKSLVEQATEAAGGDGDSKKAATPKAAPAAAPAAAAQKGKPGPKKKETAAPEPKDDKSAPEAKAPEVKPPEEFQLEAAPAADPAAVETAPEPAPVAEPAPVVDDKTLDLF